MSRSFVRLLAGVALVAVPMVAVEAQTTCTVPDVANGSCPLSFTASLNVPRLATLTVAAAGGNLTFPSPNWTAFFATPALTYTVTQTNFSVRSNSPYSVAISSGAWTQPPTAGRVPADVTYEVIADGGVCTTGAAFLGTIAVGSVAAGGPTTGQANELCLALEIPGSLTSNKLLPGAYSLPLTLTITAP